MKKTLSVRIDPELHTKVYADVNNNAYIVEKSIKQYYRSKEPNKKINSDTHTNAYNSELIELLKNQINELQQDKQYLMQRLDYFMLPWYKRILLPQHKE